MKAYDWNKINIKDKSKISKDKPIFVFGSRELSTKRISQLGKQLSSKRKVLWGIAKDEYVLGFENEPQFKTLNIDSLKNALGDKFPDINILHYFQRDINYIVKELDFAAVIFINGSWSKKLHLRPEFWTILNRNTKYKLLSPFSDEKEARSYAESIKFGNSFDNNRKYSEKELMKIADTESRKCFEHTAQVGVVIAKNGKVILAAHNTVVPYETFAMHNGSIAEKNFSPINDLNFYDTNHAEVEAIVKAANEQIDLTGTDLFINLMPCPTCAKMLSKTKIKSICYGTDHSEGYAIKILETAGKKVKRIIL